MVQSDTLLPAGTAFWWNISLHSSSEASVVIIATFIALDADASRSAGLNSGKEGGVKRGACVFSFVSRMNAGIFPRAKLRPAEGLSRMQSRRPSRRGTDVG